jgi:hypothetical protein
MSERLLPASFIETVKTHSPRVPISIERNGRGLSSRRTTLRRSLPRRTCTTDRPTKVSFDVSRASRRVNSRNAIALVDSRCVFRSDCRPCIPHTRRQSSSFRSLPCLSSTDGGQTVGPGGVRHRGRRSPRCLPDRGREGPALAFRCRFCCIRAVEALVVAWVAAWAVGGLAGVSARLTRWRAASSCRIGRRQRRGGRCCDVPRCSCRRGRCFRVSTGGADIRRIVVPRAHPPNRGRQRIPPYPVN